MTEPRQLSPEASLEMRDKVHEVLSPQLKNLVLRFGGEFVYTPPEEWDQLVDQIAAGVVNTALNVAWSDWGVPTGWISPEQDKERRDAMRDVFSASDDGSSGRDLDWDFLLGVAAKRVEMIEECRSEMRHELAELGEALGIRWCDRRCTWKNLISEVRDLKASTKPPDVGP